MPVRDAAAFLREAVASVQAQTVDSWELLIVEDGSRDATAAIALELAAGDPRIRLRHEPGAPSRGASWARNAALREARGEYVAFLDGDDMWLPPKLGEQLRLLDERREAGLLYGNTQYWYSWSGAGTPADYVPDLGVAPGTVVLPPRLLEWMLRDKAAVPCTCSLLVRRQAVERVGGFEERFREVFTDQSFYAKLLLTTPVYVDGGCWDRYRQHPASSVNRAERAGRLRALQIDYLEWLRDYARTAPLADASLRRAISRALWMNRYLPLYLRYRRAHAFAGRIRRRLARALRTGGRADTHLPG
jgi:glycosyltransferase involved in cell wall biosynthesis